MISQALKLLAVTVPLLCGGLAPASTLQIPEGKCPSTQSVDLAGLQTCGACDCTPNGGVPNANLAEAIAKAIGDFFCGCEGCYPGQTGCAPSISWTFAGASTIDVPCNMPPYPENEECEIGTQRCITVYGGTGTLDCSGCSN